MVRKLHRTHPRSSIITGALATSRPYRSRKGKEIPFGSLMRSQLQSVIPAGSSWDHKPQTHRRNLVTNGHRISGRCSCA